MRRRDVNSFETPSGRGPPNSARRQSEKGSFPPETVVSEFTRLIPAEEVPAGKAVRAEVNGKCYVVCNDNGEFHVADCVCPHAGGPLASADVRDGCVVCPVHHWPWNLGTGLTDESLPDLRLRVYLCQVREGVVYADLTASDTPHLPDLDAYFH